MFKVSSQCRRCLKCLVQQAESLGTGWLETLPLEQERRWLIELFYLIPNMTSVTTAGVENRTTYYSIFVNFVNISPPEVKKSKSWIISCSSRFYFAALWTQKIQFSTDLCSQRKLDYSKLFLSVWLRSGKLPALPPAHVEKLQWGAEL